MLNSLKSWPGDRDSNPGRCDPQRFSRPPLSTTQPSPVKEEADNWRRHPDSNRGSGLCRPVPYHLAMSPYKRYMVPGAGLEPARTNVRGILSPLRLPIPPPGRACSYILHIKTFKYHL